MKIRIENTDLEYELIYRKVKYARLEIKNGIIVDDIYYADIESAIYDIMEKEKNK